MSTGLLQSMQGNPYPGLRPFRRNEEDLFFGRESQVDAMVDKLGETHFLAVVGTSGCGKSSLVNCGLEPALRRGFLAGAGTSWRIAQMRPGVRPIANLANALAEEGVLFADQQEREMPVQPVIDATLRMSKLGLLDIVQQARLDENANLCIVVDQFEELFRFRALAGGEGREDLGGVTEEAIAFVNLLLAVKHAEDLPIYVVLTMRSDFLGDCAKFIGLPEAINDGQYLVPRLSRDERRAAISGPAGVANGTISPVLLTRLVNDVGDNPDQLSQLQHALNRTWAYWQNHDGGQGPLTLEHYEAIGTMERALDEHAEKAFAELEMERDQKICESIFKALTDKATDMRGVRRPTKLDVLCKLSGASLEEVQKVIEVFRLPSRSFLMPPQNEPLQPDKVIDISHESLMRGWQRLVAWADEEAKSARMYHRLAETAQLHARGEAGFWRDPDLQLGLAWLEQEQPTEHWAQRYNTGFDTAIAFLTASRDHQHEEEEQKRAVERRSDYLKRISAMALSVLVILSAFAWQIYQKHQLSVAKEAEARKLTALAELNARISKSNEAAFTALRTAESSDPIRGALMALRLLNPDQAKQDKDAIPAIERALWVSWSHTHVAKIIEDHKSAVRAVALSPDGALLASGSLDGTTRIYETKNWSLVKEISDGGRVYGLDFSPDGKYLATGGRTRSARLWDTSTWEEKKVFIRPTGHPHGDFASSHRGSVRTVAFSKDSQHLVSTSYDNDAIVWHVKTGHVVGLLRGHGSDVLYADFHPKMNNIVVTASWNHQAWVWDTSQRGPKRPIARFQEHEDEVKSVSFTPKGDAVMTSSDDDTVRLWDWKTGEQIGRPLAGHTADVWRAIYDKDQRRIFTASWDRTIGVWDFETHGLISRFIGHDGPLRSLAFDHKRELLASSATDKTVRIWRMETDDILKRKVSAGQVQLRAVFHPTNPRLYALGGEGGMLELWDVEGREPLQRFEIAEKNCGFPGGLRLCGVREIRFTPDGKKLVVLYESVRYKRRAVGGWLRIWETETGKPVGEPRLHSKNPEVRGIVAFALRADKDQVVSLSRGGEILFWDLNTSEPVDGLALDVERDLDTAPSNWRPRLRMDYSAPTQRLAVSVTPDEGPTLTHVWDFKTEKSLPPISLKRGPVSALRFDKSGSKLLIASSDYSLEFWDLDKNVSVATGISHKGRIVDMDVSPDGTRLATGSDDETIRVWNIEKGSELVSLGGHARSVISVSFAADNRKLATVGEDQHVLFRSIFPDVWSLRAHVCKSLKRINVQPTIRRHFADRPDMQLNALCKAG